jgi:hypothetical protein
MPNNFVIFCEARTGSYNLVSRLNSLEDIICHGEIFKKGYVEISSFHSNKLGALSVEERNSDPIGFIRTLRDINPHRHFGFKLFNHHLHWAPNIVDYLCDGDTRKVILYRDPLEVYSSNLRTKETGVWVLKEGAGVATMEADPKVEYTESTFADFVHHYNRFLIFARLLAASANSFVMHYDQVNSTEAMSALLKFIGSQADARSTSTEYKKQYLGTLANSFQNWESLMDRMRNNPFVAAPPASYPLL